MQRNRPNNNGLDVKSFVFYEPYYKDVREIENEEVQCDVLCKIIEYGLYGTPIDVSDIDPDGSLSKVVAAIKEDMDARKAKRERFSKQMSEIGKRGGAQKGNQNARKYKGIK